MRIDPFDVRHAGRAVTVAAAALLVAACASPKVLTEPIWVENAGFKTPESVLHDRKADVYLVSNINGSPLEADGNGFISRLAPSGEVLALKWIDGEADGVILHSPKGMTLSGDTLYVSDLTVVRMFDRKSGAPKGVIPIVGSGFLNDLATGPDGAVYVSDSGLKGGEGGFAPSGTDAIYRISGDTVERLAEGDQLARPNGLAVVDEQVWVVPFGANALYRIENGGRVDIAELPTGGLDGLEVLSDGRVLISSWEGKAVYAGPPEGPFEAMLSEVESPADIGVDERRRAVLVPVFLNDVVRIEPIR